MKKNLKIIISVICVILILCIAAGSVYYISHRNGEFRLSTDKQTVAFYYLGRFKAKNAEIELNGKKYQIENYALTKLDGKDKGYIKLKDKKTYYIVKGKTYSGLLGDRLFKNGLFNSSANGKLKVDDTEYLFKDGVLFTGLSEKMYYVKGLASSNSGFTKIDNINYLLEKGKLFTGLNEGLYYVDGLPDTKRTGFFKLGGTEYYFKKGRLFTGLLKKKYYKNGLFDKDKTGNIKYKKKTYYIEKGTVYSGFKNNRIYVEGLVDKKINGYKIIENVEYYFTEGAVTEVPDDVPVKILLVGNSYTYYNGMGQMLCKFIKNSGKSALVVRATKGGAGLDIILKKPLSYVCWLDGNKIAEDKKVLSEIVNTDFGSLDRKGRWDYILVQNNDIEKKVREDNVKFFNSYSDNVADKKNMLFHATYYSASSAPKRRNIINSVAAECGCSVVNSSLYYARYNSYFSRNWINDLTVRDNPKHPASKGAYLMALCIYTKIYGTKYLAKSFDDKNFIQVYNSDKGYSEEFAPNKFKRKKKTLDYAMKVTKSDAKRLQTFVSSNASDYLGEPLNERK